MERALWSRDVNSRMFLLNHQTASKVMKNHDSKSKIHNCRKSTYLFSVVLVCHICITLEMCSSVLPLYLNPLVTIVVLNKKA